VFDVADPNARIAREEIFGPVLSVLGFRDADHAIELATPRTLDWSLAAGPQAWTRR
jgi:acyl-CoA reductase-like NAD-dependent aldehyde dehydrogenase